MNRSLKHLYLVGLTVAMSMLATSAQAVIIELSVATAFQDEGTTNVDHTSLLQDLDDSWGPTTGGTVDFDYYATGTSDRYFDAVSLNFDLSSLGYANIVDATLRFYTQKGAYWDVNWEHYQLLEGAYNLTNQDAGAGAAGSIDFGGAGTLAANQTVGWLSAAIDTAWITSNSFDLTLRLWNVRLDRVELVVEVPEPATMGLLGLGLVVMGIGARTRRRLQS